MLGFSPLGVAILAAVSVALFILGFRWGRDPQYGLFGLVTVLVIAGMVGLLAGASADEPRCGSVDPITGDAPDPGDSAACLRAFDEANRQLPAAQRFELELTVRRGETAFAVVAAAGALGVVTGRLARRKS